MSGAHRYHEMLSLPLNISAGIVFCLAGKTRYSISYILPHLSKCVKGFFENFCFLKAFPSRGRGTALAVDEV